MQGSQQLLPVCYHERRTDDMLSRPGDEAYVIVHLDTRLLNIPGDRAKRNGMHAGSAIRDFTIGVNRLVSGCGLVAHLTLSYAVIEVCHRKITVAHKADAIKGIFPLFSD